MQPVRPQQISQSACCGVAVAVQYVRVRLLWGPQYVRAWRVVGGGGGGKGKCGADGAGDEWCVCGSARVFPYSTGCAALFPSSPFLTPSLPLSRVHHLQAEWLAHHCDADVDLRGRGGMTPLHWAVKGQTEAAVRWLLEKGARVDVASDAGLTARQLCDVMLDEVRRRRSRIRSRSRSAGRRRSEGRTGSGRGGGGVGRRRHGVRAALSHRSSRRGSSVFHTAANLPPSHPTADDSTHALTLSTPLHSHTPPSPSVRVTVTLSLSPSPSLPPAPPSVCPSVSVPLCVPMCLFSQAAVAARAAASDAELRGEPKPRDAEGRRQRQAMVAVRSRLAAREELLGAELQQLLLQQEQQEQQSRLLQNQQGGRGGGGAERREGVGEDGALGRLQQLQQGEEDDGSLMIRVAGRRGVVGTADGRAHILTRPHSSGALLGTRVKAVGDTSSSRSSSRQADRRVRSDQGDDREREEEEVEEEDQANGAGSTREGERAGDGEGEEGREVGRQPHQHRQLRRAATTGMLPLL
jgi:hypothetical protein